MIAIELVKPGTLEQDAALAKAVVASCAAEGVLTLSCGSYGNVVRLLPALVISDELLADGLDVVEAALRADS